MPTTAKSGSRMRRATTADEIKKLILTRDLKPGDPLPTEAELCETLNVSRSSVREVVEVRLALDLALAETIVGGAVGEDAAELSLLVDEMVDKASRGESFLEADRAFHTKLFSVTGNRLAVQLVGAFWDVHTAVIPQLGIAMPEDIQHTAEAHGDMLASALRGDVEGYRRAVIEHYHPLQRSISAATG